MRKVRVLLVRLAGLFHKERRDHDLVEEIESHVQLQVEDNLRAGMSPEDARRRALLKFGAIESVKEDYRERRSLPLLESLLQDLRYGARTLRKSPGFTAVAVATLGLGIGGCAAMYAYIQQLILLEHPYPSLDSLVVVQEVDSLDSRSNRGVTARALTDLKGESSSFEDIGGYTTDGFVLMADDRLPILDGALVTPNIFEILGVKPLLGRVFLEEEGRPGNDNVVLVSERAWKRYLSGRADIIGSTIDLSRKLYTVVGIMPDGFWRERDVWTPLGLAPSEAGRVRTWARLKQANLHSQAQAELNLLSERLARDDPQAQSTWRMSLVNPFEISDGRMGMIGALLAVGLVFLIVCVNIAHLQLGRDVRRIREMAVRLAIGASRLRVTRQLLTESLLLALLGGALGIVTALWGINAISAYLPAASTEMIGGLELTGTHWCFSCFCPPRAACSSVCCPPFESPASASRRRSRREAVTHHGSRFETGSSSRNSLSA
jgi:putative ABC transport system permease protein